MSQLGQTATCPTKCAMSALPPIPEAMAHPANRFPIRKLRTNQRKTLRIARCAAIRHDVHALLLTLRAIAVAIYCSTALLIVASRRRRAAPPSRKGCHCSLTMATLMRSSRSAVGRSFGDSVAKVPKCCAANFPLKDMTSDDCRSMWPEARRRIRP